MIPPNPVEYGNFKSYVIGFAVSILLTLAAFILVGQKLFAGWTLGIIVAILGFIQATIQLMLFFNLTREAKPRWNMVIFLFMLLIVLIVVLGSIWIMENLNYNLMAM